MKTQPCRKTTRPGKTGLMSATLLLLAMLAIAGSGLAQDAKPAALPDDLSGRLTFDFVNWIRHETEAIVDVTLPDVEFRRSASGTFGWRHPEGDLIFTQGCGAYVNRLIVNDTDGKSEIVSPCSSEIETAGSGNPQFEFSRLSADKKYISATVKYYLNSDWQYGVIVLEQGEIVAVFDGYGVSEWLPDGRLVLTGDGLYVTEVDGEPKRIDDGWLGYGVNNPDVSPDGKILAFEWNERLWIMDTEGKEHKELVAGPARYRFPAWSPDGNYVAFLSTTGDSHSEVDRAIQMIDIRRGEFEIVDLRPFGGQLNHVPFGPLSWTP